MAGPSFTAPHTASDPSSQASAPTATMDLSKVSLEELIGLWKRSHIVAPDQEKEEPVNPKPFPLRVQICFKEDDCSNKGGHEVLLLDATQNFLQLKRHIRDHFHKIQSGDALARVNLSHFNYIWGTEDKIIKVKAMWGECASSWDCHNDCNTASTTLTNMNCEWALQLLKMRSGIDVLCVIVADPTAE